MCIVGDLQVWSAHETSVGVHASVCSKCLAASADQLGTHGAGQCLCVPAQVISCLWQPKRRR